MSLNLQSELHARNVGKFEGQSLENRHKVPLPSSLRILTFGSLAVKKKMHTLEDPKAAFFRRHAYLKGKHPVCCVCYFVRCDTDACYRLKR